MNIRRLLLGLALVVVSTTLFSPMAMASLGAGGLSRPIEDEEPVLPLALTDLIVEPDTNVSGRYPLSVTFQSVSLVNGNPITSWLWDFKDGVTSREQNPTHVFYGIQRRSVTLSVAYTENGIAKSAEDYCLITAILPSPSTLDEASLAGLQASFRGMREMIEKHPSRNTFNLGTVEYDNVWYGFPRQYPPLPCEAEGISCQLRHWHSCPAESPCGCTCNYCLSDPRIPSDHWVTLPLDNTIGNTNTCTRDYLSYEFNTITQCNSTLMPSIARNATLDPVSHDPSVTYNYGFAQDTIDFANENNMQTYAPAGLLYFLPSWIAHNAYTHELTAPAIKDWITGDGGYLDTMISNFNTASSTNAYRYYNVVNEFLPDSPWSEPTCFADLAETNTEFKSWPSGSANDERWHYWPWHVLADENNQGSAELCEEAFFDAYRIANTATMNSTLVYNDYGIEFKNNDGTTTVQPKYRRLMKLLEYCDAENVPLDAVGFQMHLPAWSCLRYSGSFSVEAAQLRSIRDALRGVEEAGYTPIISEMDIRIGFPASGSNDYLYLNDRMDGDNDSNPVVDRTYRWTGLTLSAREQLQKEVYESILNASLAVTSLAAVLFWDITDECSWLNMPGSIPAGVATPGYPDAGSCRPCLFGDNPATTTEREMWYPKPAYYGVRNAITNYFGSAFVVKDADGNEFARFVENGNIVLLKQGVTIDDDATNLTAGTNDFLIKNSAGTIVAMISPSANKIILAGSVYERQQTLSQGDHTAFRIASGSNADIVCLIDDEGNLKTKGYILLDGIPYVAD